MRRIHALYDDGLLRRDIARTAGVHIGTARKYLRLPEPPPEPIEATASPAKPRLSVDELRLRGYRPMQIAAITGRSYREIFNQGERNG